MRVWLIEVGEPLRRFEPKVRLWRMRALALELVRRGHPVTWCASTFDHIHKRHHADGPAQFEDEGISYRLLHAPAYSRNVSVARLWNHRCLSRLFRKETARATSPDLIVAALPTIELALAATDYGRARNIPVVIDIRDLWPDVFATAVPPPLRPLAQAALVPYRSMARRALAGADALIAVSDGYLEWGLRQAGRAQRDADRVFPLGYPDRAASAADPRAALDALHRLGVDPGRRICWFAGTFGRSCDLVTVIDAAREFQRRGIDEPQFVLCGAGEQDSALRERACDLRNVVFTGWLDRAQLEAAGACAWIGLQSYREGVTQGLANKLFEYLSFGLPVISSLAGENAAFVTQHGVGVNYRAGDASSLFESIRELLADTAKAASMRARARALFEQKFSATAIYSQMASHLERLHANRR